MKNIILGTDWWTDCDDAVALRIIARSAKAQKINLLGVAINACMEHSVASLKGFLKAEHLEQIPLGIDHEATDFGGNPPYQKRLALNFCPEASNADAMDAVRLYRKLLTESKEPVEIVEIGYLQVISAVIASGPDDISEKNGRELILEKVSKLWVMAGKWDKDGEKENNFSRNTRARIAAEAFCRTCPVPVTFLGYEAAFDVITGDQLSSRDFLHQALADHGSASGRSSWDPMLVLLAIIGDESAAGYNTITGTARVDAVTGQNYFDVTPDGLHKYVIKKYDNSYYRDAINNIIQ